MIIILHKFISVQKGMINSVSVVLVGVFGEKWPQEISVEAHESSSELTQED